MLHWVKMPLQPMYSWKRLGCLNAGADKAIPYGEIGKIKTYRGEKKKVGNKGDLKKRRK